MSALTSINVNLKSPLHKFIIRAIRARVTLSTNGLHDRLDLWKQSEEDFIAYMPEREADATRKANRKNGNPEFTSIIVPYGYATLMSAHTYWVATLLGRSPIWSFTARHGEGEMNVQAVESLMDYQMTQGRMLPPLFVWLMDVGKYGLGIVWNTWEEERHYFREIVTEPVSLNGVGLEGHTRKVNKIKAIKGYEGNKLFNVKPQDYIPDTRVPLTDPDKGEFVGRHFELSFNDLVKGKQTGEYIAENVDEMLRRMKNSGKRTNDGSSQIIMPGENAVDTSEDPETGLSSKVACVEMVVDLVPSLWGLGKTDFVEKWVFTITHEGAGTDVVLGVRPYGSYHGKFPARVLEVEVDGYGLFKRSMLDIARPMNDVLTWLFNSHMYNVRKSLNGELIYDPSKVYSSDITDPGAGKRIRLRPEAYGTDVRTVVGSIGPGADVTQNHLGDMRTVTDLLQRVVGVTDNVMGQVNPGGRKSATEARQATSASVTRLKTMTEYFSATGFSQLADMLVQNSQQFYTGEMKLKIVGDTPNNLETFMNVNSDMIAGSYDYVPVDGNMPMDKVATVNMWANFLSQTRNFPQFTAEYDIGRIIAYVMQLGGLRNIKQFKVQSVSPEVIASEQARGNLVPIPGHGSTQRAGPLGGSEGAVRDQGQLPGAQGGNGVGRTA